ncbi:MAG: CheR family methyltransferase, partial [Pseudomonadota bacterium]
FKIIYRRWQDLLGAAPRLEILATDLNPDYLEKARTGIYNPSSLRDASEEVKSAYFSVRGRHFSLDPALKTGLVWREHDLLSGPPDGLFDLVFLRNNILTYYPEHLKTRALKNAFQALVQGGFLIIGAHEKLPATAKGLSGYAGEPYIFRKIDQGP